MKFLQKERKRLNLDRLYVADFVGTSPQTLSTYENDKAYPNFRILLKMAELGYDIQYVMTGKRDKNHLTNEEKFLLEKFREADKRKQNMVLGMLILDDNNVNFAKNIIGDINGNDVKIKQK